LFRYFRLFRDLSSTSSHNLRELQL
jgi:hypothetical protein